MHIYLPRQLLWKIDDELATLGASFIDHNKKKKKMLPICSRNPRSTSLQTSVTGHLDLGNISVSKDRICLTVTSILNKLS